MNGEPAVHVRAIHGSGARAVAAVRRWTVILAAGVIFAVGLGAADDNQIIFPNGGARPTAPASSGGGVVNLVTLILALALAAVGAWLFWRNRRSPGIGRDGRLLAIDETRSLGNRQYLVVASFEGRKFLLGVCPGRIDLLAPLDSRSTPPSDSR